jgi:hypothetical protein
MYTWNELERTRDVYDFSPIRRDLEYLKERGKRLFLQLQDTTFDPDKTAVPDYLLTMAEFNGGVVFQYNDRGEPEGQALQRWNASVRGRLHRLLMELGKEFDKEIAGIALQETSIGVKEGASGFTYPGYRDAILDNMRMLKKAFPLSISMQYANFMPGEWLPQNDNGYLRSIFEYAAMIGVGIGAPDLMPDKPNQKAHAYKFMHESKDRALFGIAVQDGNYSGTTGIEEQPVAPWPNLVPSLNEFAITQLKVQYIFWGAQEPYFSHDVLPYFRNRLEKTND